MTTETSLRDTGAVVLDHLRRRERGDIEGDLRHNYAPDVVLLTGLGLFRGLDGVRTNAKLLADYLGHPSYTITNYLCDAETAFIEWTSTGGSARVCDGADSFVVRDGRIVVQAIHYTVRGEPDAARRHARTVAAADREQPPHPLGEDIDGPH